MKEAEKVFDRGVAISKTEKVEILEEARKQKAEESLQN